MMTRSERMFKNKTVELPNFEVPNAKCDAKIVTPSPTSVAGKQSDKALFLNGGFQPIQHDRSDIKTEL